MVALERLLLEIAQRLQRPRVAATITPSQASRIITAVQLVYSDTMAVDAVHSIGYIMRHTPGSSAIFQTSLSHANRLVSRFYRELRYYHPFPTTIACGSRSPSGALAERGHGARPYASPYYVHSMALEPLSEIGERWGSTAGSVGPEETQPDLKLVHCRISQDFRDVLSWSMRNENLASSALLEGFNTYICGRHSSLVDTKERCPLRMPSRDAHAFDDEMEGLHAEAGASASAPSETVEKDHGKAHSAALPFSKELRSQTVELAARVIDVLLARLGRCTDGIVPDAAQLSINWHLTVAPAAAGDLGKFYGLCGTTFRAKVLFYLQPVTAVTREHLSLLISNIGTLSRHHDLMIASPERMDRLRSIFRQLPIFNDATATLDMPAFKMVIGLLELERDAQCVTLGQSLWRGTVEPTWMELNDRYLAYRCGQERGEQLHPDVEYLWASLLASCRHMASEMVRRIRRPTSLSHQHLLLLLFLPVMSTRLFADSLTVPRQQHSFLSSCVDLMRSGALVEFPALERCLQQSVGNFVGTSIKGASAGPAEGGISPQPPRGAVIDDTEDLLLGASRQTAMQYLRASLERSGRYLSGTTVTEAAVEGSNCSASELCATKVGSAAVVGDPLLEQIRRICGLFARGSDPSQMTRVAVRDLEVLLSLGSRGRVTPTVPHSTQCPAGGEPLSVGGSLLVDEIVASSAEDLLRRHLGYLGWNGESSDRASFGDVEISRAALGAGNSLRFFADVEVLFMRLAINHIVESIVFTQARRESGRREAARGKPIRRGPDTESFRRHVQFLVMHFPDVVLPQVSGFLGDIVADKAAALRGTPLSSRLSRFDGLILLAYVRLVDMSEALLHTNYDRLRAFAMAVLGLRLSSRFFFHCIDSIDVKKLLGGYGKDLIYLTLSMAHCGIVTFRPPEGCRLSSSWSSAAAPASASDESGLVNALHDVRCNMEVLDADLQKTVYSDEWLTATRRALSPENFRGISWSKRMLLAESMLSCYSALADFHHTRGRRTQGDRQRDRSADHSGSGSRVGVWRSDCEKGERSEVWGDGHGTRSTAARGGSQHDGVILMSTELVHFATQLATVPFPITDSLEAEAAAIPARVVEKGRNGQVFSSLSSVFRSPYGKRTTTAVLLYRLMLTVLQRPIPRVNTDRQLQLIAQFVVKALRPPTALAAAPGDPEEKRRSKHFVMCFLDDLLLHRIMILTRVYIYTVRRGVAQVTRTSYPHRRHNPSEGAQEGAAGAQALAEQRPDGVVRYAESTAGLNRAKTLEDFRRNIRRHKLAINCFAKVILSWGDTSGAGFPTSLAEEGDGSLPSRRENVVRCWTQIVTTTACLNDAMDRDRTPLQVRLTGRAITRVVEFQQSELDAFAAANALPVGSGERQLLLRAALESLTDSPPSLLHELLSLELLGSMFPLSSSVHNIHRRLFLVQLVEEVMKMHTAVSEAASVHDEDRQPSLDPAMVGDNATVAAGDNLGAEGPPGSDASSQRSSPRVRREVSMRRFTSSISTALKTGTVLFQ